MPKITNLNYRQFLDKGLIDIIDYKTLLLALRKVDGINGQHIQEGRALLIALYYTGGRPVEVLEMTAKQIQKQESYVTIEMQAAKAGLNRTIFLPYRYAAVKELYKYAVTIFTDMYLFYHYRSKRQREVKGKSYTVITDNVYYHVKKWFTGVVKNKTVSPYFLRHNRFSQLSEAGLRDSEIQQLKGAKSLASVQPYLHLSSRTAKKIARHIK